MFKIFIENNKNYFEFEKKLKQIKKSKKSNLQVNKFEEVPFATINSFSPNMTTNITSESGKGLSSSLVQEQNTTNSLNNSFLGKKTSSHFFVIKEKENKIENKTSQRFYKKKADKKILSLNSIMNEGRWSNIEHIKFIEAIVKHGNEWREVQKYVCSRSSAQARSHAQKFFLKLKTYKIPSLGLDFNDQNIKSLSDIIDSIKKVDENNVINILIRLSFNIPENKQVIDFSKPIKNELTYLNIINKTKINKLTKKNSNTQSINKINESDKINQKILENKAENQNEINNGYITNNIHIERDRKIDNNKSKFYNGSLNLNEKNKKANEEPNYNNISNFDDKLDMNKRKSSNTSLDDCMDIYDSVKKCGFKLDYNFQKAVDDKLDFEKYFISDGLLDIFNN